MAQKHTKQELGGMARKAAVCALRYGMTSRNSRDFAFCGATGQREFVAFSFCGIKYLVRVPSRRVVNAASCNSTSGVFVEVQTKTGLCFLKDSNLLTAVCTGLVCR
jgi:hypothetical protein